MGLESGTKLGHYEIAKVALKTGTWSPERNVLVNYDYDSVKKRFLVIREGTAADTAAPSPQIITVLNWFEGLKERVPLPE